MDLERQLYDDYVSYWRRTSAVRQVQHRVGKPRLRPLEYTRERQAALRDMALWCIDHGADPRLWLYTLFVARCWIYAPTFRQLCPKSHLKRYRKERRLGLFKERLAHERRSRRRAQGDGYDPNVDLNGHVEAVKGELVRTGRTEACIKRMRTETFGYHPKSEVCASCPAQKACQTTLQKAVPAFDILALRRGDISAAQAGEQWRTCWQARIHPEGLIYGPRA